MKITVTNVPVPVPPRKVTVEMSEAEAQSLREFFSILTPNVEHAWEGLESLGDALRDEFEFEIPDSRVVSFVRSEW